MPHFHVCQSSEVYFSPPCSLGITVSVSLSFLIVFFLYLVPVFLSPPSKEGRVWGAWHVACQKAGTHPVQVAQVFKILLRFWSSKHRSALDEHFPNSSRKWEAHSWAPCYSLQMAEQSQHHFLEHCVTDAASTFSGCPITPQVLYLKKTVISHQVELYFPLYVCVIVTLVLLDLLYLLGMSSIYQICS